MGEKEEIGVLLVEDDPDDALLIRQMLAEAGDVRFRVECAGRLSEGLERISEQGADVLLLDLGLPDGVGFETFATAHAQAPDVPIVVLTGLNDQAVGLHAMREGAQDYLVKGHVDAEVLVRSVRYAIERKRLELRLARALEALDREFQTVADVQACLLPEELPRVKSVEVAVHYRPAERAGGDYFDFFPLPDDRLAILLADVSGHGAHAAVLMAMTRVVAHSLENMARPELAMAELNRQLVRNMPRGQFVAASHAVLDRRRLRLSLAVAGQPAPVYFDPTHGECRLLCTEPVPALGIVPEVRYMQSEFALAPGGLLLFYTDGIIEPQGVDGEEFGQARLSEVVRTHQQAGAQAVCTEAVAALATHCPLEDLRDDITLVAVRLLPEGQS